jgi:hypothetical protein
MGIIRLRQSVKGIVAVVDRDGDFPNPTGDLHLRFQASWDRIVIDFITPELHAVIICSETVISHRQCEDHLAVGVARAMETGVALSRDGIHR